MNLFNEVTQYLANSSWWNIYFWLSFAYVVWWCEVWAEKHTDYDGKQIAGSLMVAVLLGWLIWPILLARQVYGKPFLSR